MDKYTEISTLNQGSYGVVQLVRQHKTSRLYAAKRVSLALSSKEEVDEEIKVHSRVAQHPRVAQLVDHFLDPSTNEYVLIIEYCSGGDLHDAIARGDRPSNAEIKKIILQLLETLEFCHSQGVYHRDVKPENIFLQHNGAIKLGDWGLATTTRHCRDFGTGSEQYMAPECFDRTVSTYDAAKADIWAAGIVLLNMLFGHNPFKEASERDPLFKDFANSRDSLFDIFPTLTRDVFSALRYALTLNPDHRSISKMREALLKVRNWSTDDEIEQIEQIEQSEQHDQIRQKIQRSLVFSDYKASDVVPIVHKPFRVPSAVARSLHTPTNQWDRRKMFTPPTKPHASQNGFAKFRNNSTWKPGSYKQSASLPKHIETPEEEQENDDTRQHNNEVDKLCLETDLDHDLVDHPSSPSSTSSTSSTASGSHPLKPETLDAMFSMDHDDKQSPFYDNTFYNDNTEYANKDKENELASGLANTLDAPSACHAHKPKSMPYGIRKIQLYR